MIQVTLRLGTLGSPLGVVAFGTAVKVSVPAGKSSIFTVLKVDVMLTVMVEMRVKGLLVAPVRVPSVAERVNVPAMVANRFENVATPGIPPAEAGTVVVEPALNDPPLLIVIKTVEVSVVTTLPPLSSTLTATGAKGF